MLRRLPAAAHASDFLHHAPGVARLNNGSFGSTPRLVIDAEAAHRDEWRSNPDALYFGTGTEALDARLAAAADAAAGALGAPNGSVALIENATMAVAIIANRWARRLRERPGRSGVLLLDACYKAVEYSLRAICEPAGAQLHHAPVPFPGTTSEEILRSLDATLCKTNPRFALLDHVSSQPALVLPIAEMVALCRDHGVEEIAVDGAHGVGLLSRKAVDVTSIGADWYLSNLHKWAFASGPVTAVHAAEASADELEPPRMASTPHVVPSWHAGRGLLVESRWPGTRDFASALAVPTALSYLDGWRSADGLTASEYNREGWKCAAATLSEAWGVAPAVSDPALTGCGMGMVRLPPTLDLSADAPGQPSTGVRSTLRARYGIEAAVGGFGVEGGFLRLSHAVYTTDDDIERLRDAVSELAASPPRRSRDSYIIHV